MPRYRHCLWAYWTDKYDKSKLTAVELSWENSNGQKRTSKKIDVPDIFGQKVYSSEKIIVSAISIQYIDADSDWPLILELKEHFINDYKFDRNLGIILFSIGILIVFFIVILEIRSPAQSQADNSKSSS